MQFEHENEFILKIINSPDTRGIYPLFLCIYLREANKNNEIRRKTILEIIKLLIKSNVKIKIRNEES